MTRIFNCYIKNGFHRDVELAHFLDAMLIDIAKNASEPENKIQKLSTSINYINENYTKELNVPELAKMEFLSVSRYIALFKEVTGSSPYQYVISLRLNTACEMLRDSSLSVTQIAEVLGFQNCFFFSKLFKKHLKMSPTQYKKQSLNIKAD
jgi:transcriptional regulator GlxA family with amidase domain